MIFFIKIYFYKNREVKTSKILFLKKIYLDFFFYTFGHLKRRKIKTIIFTFNKCI